MCVTMRRLCDPCLSSGTSPERIAPESVTPIHSGFVHRNISRKPCAGALDQVWRGPTSLRFDGEFLKVGAGRSRIRSRQESRRFMVVQLLPVILRCEPSGALAPLGEPRRMSGHGLTSFEGRACARPPQDDGQTLGSAVIVFATRGVSRSLSPCGGPRRAKLALEVGVRGNLRGVELAESPPHPALCADLSPQAGRGILKRQRAVNSSSPRAGALGW
jgi:hypothetical protein